MVSSPVRMPIGSHATTPEYEVVGCLAFTRLIPYLHIYVPLPANMSYIIIIIIMMMMRIIAYI